MSLETLTQYEVLYGALTLVFVIISILIGVRILLNYFSTKVKTMITVGLTWIFLSSAWWGGAFSFLSFLFFSTKLNDLLYMTVNNIFIPIALVCWIYSFTSLTYPNLKTKLVWLFVIICVVFEILFVIFLFTNPSLIGTFEGVFNLQAGDFSMIFQIFALIVAFLTGILFSLRAMKSEDERIKWKGRFLLIAYIIFTLGAAIEAIITLDAFLLFLMRLILIFSGIFYYLGFLLPERLAKKLIQEV